MAAVVEAATVTDSEGNVVDTAEFFGPPAGSEDDEVIEDVEDVNVEEVAEVAEAVEQEAEKSE